MEFRENTVSVIIPTFKRPERLSRAVESVLKQDFKEFEIIVVDDNEPNSLWRKETELKMKNFLHDSRVKYIQSSKNSNGAVARNIGIKESTGKYIFFLDDDDIFLQHKIFSQVLLLENKAEFHAAYTGVIKNGKRNHPNLSGNLLYELLKMETELYTPTLCFRREALEQLKGFNESFIRHQDYELMARFFIMGYKIGVVSEPYVLLGENDGENIPKAIILEEIKKKYLTDFDSYINNLPRKNKKKIYISHYIAVSFAYYKEKKIRDSIRILKLALKQSILITILILFQNIKWKIEHCILILK